MILTVVGARPQFVKAAVVSRALATAGIEEQILHTGQHYDAEMSRVFWDELAIPPVATNLEVGSGTHGRQTARMLEGIEQHLLAAERTIDGVVVYGDTNSTLAATLAAAKLGIPVFHVEAGLRSHNRSMPEELNRIVADHLAAALFCSSEAGVRTLADEGITDNVHQVGDVMYDALLMFRGAAKRAVEGLALPGTSSGFVLMTVHRPSNTDDPARLQEIVDGAGRIEASVVWPVHPRARVALAAVRVPANVQPVRPLSYLEMLGMLERCDAVITDSGGVQKEAYWTQRRCLTVRDETEWTETLTGGWNQLVGASSDRLLAAWRTPPVTNWQPLYGDGTASRQIANVIQQYLGT